MVFEPMLVAVGDRRFLGREVDPDLCVRIARAVPTGERIRPLGLLPLELKKPQSCIRLAGLSGLALEFQNACNRHDLAVAKCCGRIKPLVRLLEPREAGDRLEASLAATP